MSTIEIAYNRLEARAGRRQRDKVEVESKAVNDGSTSYRRFASVRESSLG